MYFLFLSFQKHHAQYQHYHFHDRHYDPQAISAEQQREGQDGKAAQEDVSEERNAERALHAENRLQIIRCQQIDSHRKEGDEIHPQAFCGDGGHFCVHVHEDRADSVRGENAACGEDAPHNDDRHERHVFHFFDSLPFSCAVVCRDDRLDGLADSGEQGVEQDDAVGNDAVYGQRRVSAVFQNLNIEQQDDEAVCKLIKKAWDSISDDLADAGNDMLWLDEFQSVFAAEKVGDSDDYLDHHADNGCKCSAADSHLQRKDEDDIEHNVGRAAKQNACHRAVRVTVCADEDGHEIGKYGNRQEDVDVPHVCHRIRIQRIISAHHTQQHRHSKAVYQPQDQGHNGQSEEGKGKVAVRFLLISGSTVNAHLHRSADAEQDSHRHQDAQKRCCKAQRGKRIGAYAFADYDGIGQGVN